MSKNLIIRLNGRKYNVEIDGSNVRVNDKEVRLEELRGAELGTLEFASDSRRFRAVFDFHGEEKIVQFQGRELTFEFETERQRLLRRVAGLGVSARVHADIKASMPGMVVRVNCTVGMEVKKGQPILILEAMKMENEIRSPLDGIIKEVLVGEAQPVEKGDLLVVLE
jgi:biotin carboxyl carrier protein